MPGSVTYLLKMMSMFESDGTGPEPLTNCQLPGSVLLMFSGCHQPVFLGMICHFAEAAVRVLVPDAARGERLMPSSLALQESRSDGSGENLQEVSGKVICRDKNE